MAENKKKMIRVTFTGKELLGGAVFDTTDENTAKNAGIFDQGRKYSPLTIITGENELLPLVEKELERMKEGEEKLLKLLSKDAFGERQSDLVRVVPLQNFHDQKINPYPGLVLRIGKALGKIQSVGSGRVRIDFNHPLAGRDVEYNIKLEKEFKDKKEVSEQIFEKYFSIIPGSKKEIKEDELTITLEGNAFKNLTKITEAVKRLALEFGIKAEFKEGETINKIETVGEKGHEYEHHEHVHGPNCNHEQENYHEQEHQEHVHGPNCNHAHEELIEGEKESEKESEVFEEEAEEILEQQTRKQNEEKERIFESAEALQEEKTAKKENKIIDGDAKATKVAAENTPDKLSGKPISINRFAETLAKQKKSGTEFVVTRDASSTIQRPKKKN